MANKKKPVVAESVEQAAPSVKAKKPSKTTEPVKTSTITITR